VATGIHGILIKKPTARGLSFSTVTSVVALFSVLVAISAAGQPSATFSVGVLRRDGIVVPFATFDGKRWQSHWPEPTEKVNQIPISVTSVPSRWWSGTGPLATWQAWVGTKPPQMLHVRQPDWFPVHCVRQIGLRTDYQPSESPPGFDAEPYPKDGLVVSPPQPVETIEIVPVGTIAVARELRTAFDEAEDKAIAELRSNDWIDPAVRMDRKALPLSLEAAYAHGDADGPRTYYLELSREYVSRDPKRPGCLRATFGSGWFLHDRSGLLRATKFVAGPVDCDRSSALYMLPLGIIRATGRLYWIFQQSGWDFESYVITEIRSGRPGDSLHVVGGYCKR
jgi:hypothetical protein